MSSPLLFWDIGFRLSVLAALTIAAASPKGVMVLAVSPLVALVTFPQVSYTFGGVVLAGLVLNIAAPLYFSFALTMASGLGILRLLNVPLLSWAMFAIEGIFLLWERVADLVAELLPYSLGWNYLIAWAGTGTLMFCLCRYFRLAPLRTLAVTVAGTLAGFMMFMGVMLQ